jgi:hypothetical protein
MTADSKSYGGHAELRHQTIVSERQYKLTYGMIETDGNIYADITLSYLNNGTYTQIYHNTLNTMVTVEEMKTALNISSGDLKGKIILYAAIKGENVNTTFKFSQPYQQGE